MPDLILLIVGFFMFVICTIVACSKNGNKVFFIGSIIGLFLVMWAIFANITCQVEKTYLVDFKTEEVDNGTIQYVLLNQKYINLNKKFGAVLNEGDKVEVTKYKDYSLGICVLDDEAHLKLIKKENVK